MAMVHIIGAGVSGLAAATQLSAAHVPVRVYEATANAGGRARSSTDPKLGSIDHGLHIIGGDSPELFAYLTRIGALESLTPIRNPYLPPAAPIADYFALFGLLIKRRVPFGSILPEDNRLRDLWAERFARAQLHTPLDTVSVAAMWRALWRMARRPRKAYQVKDSLQESLISPALAHLEYQGTSLYFNHQLKGLERKDGAITSLTFARQKVAVASDDIVILATPGAVTQQLFSEVKAPTATHSSITLHYKIAHTEPHGTTTAPADAPIDTIRYEANRISLSIRVANDVWHSDPSFLAERLWRWLQKQHLALSTTPLPPYAIWREKQAGHQLTVDDVAVIPELPPRFFLAGDWLAPHTPSSLENAAASGHRAATSAMAILDAMPKRRQ